MPGARKALKFGGAGKSWDKVVTMVNTKDTSRVRTKKVSDSSDTIHNDSKSQTSGSR
jgi:hypothetical protein